VPEPDGSFPGLCASERRCAPGDGSCGAGYCVVEAPQTTCDWAGTARAGQRCEATSDDPALHCVADLACVLGRCKAACGAGGSCPQGQRCLDYTSFLDGGQTLDFCHANCSVATQTGCARGEACVYGGSDATGIVGACFARQAGQGTHGDPCAVDDASYWGSCTAAHLCTPIFEGDDPRCIQFCDAEHLDVCGGGAACVIGVLGDDVPALGLCLGECDAYATANSGCGAGQVCGLGFVGVDAAGDDVVTGFCTASAGQRGPGEACNDPAGNNIGDCRTGYVCGTLTDGAPTQCVRICRADAFGASDDCAAGETCAVGALGPQDSPSLTIGACVPQP
jgi:hypothetical protein